MHSAPFVPRSLCYHYDIRVNAGSRAKSTTLLMEVGGSRARAALAGPTGPAGRREVSIPGAIGERHEEFVLDVVARVGDQAVGGFPSCAVVAWPGPVDPAGRAWASPTTSGGTTCVDVRAELSARWGGAEVCLVNDLTAAGLRLVHAGLSDFAVVTVGSGIGHKVFLEGVPRTGPSGRGGEIGHLLFDRSAEAPRCTCGGIGHLGALASGAAIVGAVVTLWGGQASVGDVADPGPRVVAAYAAGDVEVVQLVTERAGMLGWGLAALHATVGVETFVLVGGFAIAAGEAFREAVARGASAATWDLGLDWDAAVLLGENDDDHGLVGAWHLARAKGWA